MIEHVRAGGGGGDAHVLCGIKHTFADANERCIGRSGEHPKENLSLRGKREILISKSSRDRVDFETINSSKPSPHKFTRGVHAQCFKTGEACPGKAYLSYHEYEATIKHRGGEGRGMHACEGK